MSLASRLVFSFVSLFSGVVFATESGVSFPSSNYILIDAKAQSCAEKLRENPKENILSLYADLGKMSVKWEPKSVGSILRPIYIKFKFVSDGLAGEQQSVIAGEELNCLLTGDLDKTGQFDGLKNEFTALNNLLVGGLMTMDQTKQQSFQGTAFYTVYAIQSAPGFSDEPVVLENSFEFQFDGVR